MTSPKSETIWMAWNPSYGFMTDWTRKTKPSLIKLIDGRDWIPVKVTITPVKKRGKG